MGFCPGCRAGESWADCWAVHDLVKVGFQRKACSWGEPGFYFDNFIRLYYQKRPFGDHQGIHWNVARNEKITSERASLDVNVHTI